MIQMTQNARNHDNLTTDVTVQIVQNRIVRVTLITFAKDVYIRFLDIQNVETANKHRTSY